MKRAVILYWSSTGNTEKVAFAIKEGLETAGVNVSLMKTTEEDLQKIRIDAKKLASTP